MVKRTRTRIAVETERVIVITGGDKALVDWCEGCGKRVEMIRFEQASVSAGESQQWLLKKMEAGNLHITHLAGGSIFICLNSLLG